MYDKLGQFSGSDRGDSQYYGYYEHDDYSDVLYHQDEQNSHSQGKLIIIESKSAIWLSI